MEGIDGKMIFDADSTEIKPLAAYIEASIEDE